MKNNSEFQEIIDQQERELEELRELIACHLDINPDQDEREEHLQITEEQEQLFRDTVDEYCPLGDDE